MKKLNHLILDPIRFFCDGLGQIKSGHSEIPNSHTNSNKMNWITEKTTASEVVNTCGNSILEIIASVDFLIYLKKRSVVNQAVKRIKEESEKKESDMDWKRVIADIQNLTFKSH